MRLELTNLDAAAWGLVPRWGALAVRILRERALWLVLIPGLVALSLAYQSPRSLFVDIGGTFDNPHTPGFYAPEKSGDATFRWSAANSSFVFKGIGKPLSPFTVNLQLSSGRPKGSAPINVGVTINGHEAPPLSVVAQSALYIVTVDPAWLDASGDLRLDFVSPTFQSGADKRRLGFLADFVRVDLPAGLSIPSLPQLFWLLLCAALLYWVLRAIWLVPRTAGIFTLAFLLACAGVIALQRLLLTPFTTRLAFTLALSVLLAMVAEPLTRRITRLAGWRGDKSLPEWAWAGLRGLVIATAAIKIGGLLYPSTYLIDAYFHLKYITYMSEGRPWEQFFGQSLAFSVMPKDEWGSAQAFIPYSPFFYVIAAPLAWLPLPLSLSVPLFSGILEALRVPMLFTLGLALGRRHLNAAQAGRLAFSTAAVYSVIPATFLLQQWANWPTTTSLWLATLWVATTSLFWSSIARSLTWIVTTLLLTLTMLSYTVTALYVGIVVGVLVVGGWLFAPAERRKWGAVALSTVAATILSLLSYYGQYVGLLLQKTLPTFSQAIETQGKLTTLRPTVGEFLVDHLGRAMQSYDLAIIYALGFAGTLWLFLRGASLLHGRGSWRSEGSYGLVARPATWIKGEVSWQKVWIGAWLLTFPLFTLADFWVDQALKQFWFALPAIALVGAMWLLSLHANASRAARALAWLLAATLTWQSISLWVFRLFFHNR
ncbi:MAG: hypothetical protein IVW55_06100 [Chloroflexi bacterium]|nr:hypothetical protein [Chloroflexota bacterium]